MIKIIDIIIYYCWLFYIFICLNTTAIHDTVEMREGRLKYYSSEVTTCLNPALSTTTALSTSVQILTIEQITCQF
jgi:hypothetical protein